MIILVLAILQLIPGNIEGSGQRIVGGYCAKIKEFPFVVSVQHKGKHICGGAIIKPKFILTAAHCYTSTALNWYKIKAGVTNLSEKGTVRKIIRGIVHPEYDPSTSKNDVALLELSRPLHYKRSRIQPVNLPKQKVSVPLTWGAVMGWGDTINPKQNSNQLRAVKLQVYTNQDCENKLSAYDYLDIDETMFCAGEPTGTKDSCQGDSGGPFVINRTIYGVVSHGTAICASGAPGIYSNIPNVVSWIKKNIK